MSDLNVTRVRAGRYRIECLHGQEYEATNNGGWNSLRPDNKWQMIRIEDGRPTTSRVHRRTLRACKEHVAEHCEAFHGEEVT